jgi:hypothetical protein
MVQRKAAPVGPAEKAEKAVAVVTAGVLPSEYLCPCVKMWSTKIVSISSAKAAGADLEDMAVKVVPVAKASREDL